ncbi:MAG: hypothetical protein LUE93_14665 [Bacteroides sp.]|nr:hypothetical protein [Bacteroides sp.]
MKNRDKETPLEQVNEALFEVIVQGEIMESSFSGNYHYLPELKAIKEEEIFKKFPYYRQLPASGNGSCREYHAYTAEGILFFTTMEGRCVEHTLVPYRKERTKRLYQKLFGNRW